MILTLGVAADANIVIFERIKEEYRAGKSVRAAIAAGYAQGLRDDRRRERRHRDHRARPLRSSRPRACKGFALMLLIGTADLDADRGRRDARDPRAARAASSWFDNPRLMGAEGELPTWLRRDFIGRRNRWFAISGVVVVLSIGAIAINGLNLGIDFEGGTQITLTDAARRSRSSEVRAAGGDGSARAAAQIQGAGDALAGGRYKEFRIRTERSRRPSRRA